VLSVLPRAVVALRMRIFAAVNGDEGVPIPGPLVDAEQFRDVYGHPAANGRSRGAALSDLFWYWLAPGPHVHQEHLEAGDRYDAVARTTRRFLARPKAELADLTRRRAAGVLDAARTDRSGIAAVRLRDLVMPIWAEVYYELVFDEPCPAEARALIVANATDVITALKCTGLRHMSRRDRLTAYLHTKLTQGRPAVPLPNLLSVEEQAWYLQGTFFNTAVVQMSEATTHLLLVLAQHDEVQDRLAAAWQGDPADGVQASGVQANGVQALGDAYADRVIEEALRCYPLFGIAHRISTGEIAVDETTTLPAGSVLCFNYPAYHSTGHRDPDRFDPERWAEQVPRDVHHIPFGVTTNRPCPARGVAPLTMRVVAEEVLRRFTLRSTAAHTRSIPNRGPCLLIRRADGGDAADTDRQVRRRLARMRVRDQWEDVGRSIVQLVLGTWMVLDARRQRLTQRYFATQPESHR
jgi:Cytochrome P450